jgi:hypothetical protein
MAMEKWYKRYGYEHVIQTAEDTPGNVAAEEEA